MQSTTACARPLGAVASGGGDKAAHSAARRRANKVTGVVRTGATPRVPEFGLALRGVRRAQAMRPARQ